MFGFAIYHCSPSIVRSTWEASCSAIEVPHSVEIAGRSNQPLPVTTTQVAESPAKAPTNEWQYRFSMQHFWRWLFLCRGRGRLTNCTTLWGNSFPKTLYTYSRMVVTSSATGLVRFLASLPFSESRLSLAGAVDLFIGP